MSSDATELTSTSEVIVRASLALFADKTYEGTSIREIASAVGIRPASLYNHYASKEDILWQIVNRAWTMLHKVQSEGAIGAQSTLERFRSFVRSHTRFHAEEPQLAQITNRLFGCLEEGRCRQIIEFRADYEHGLRRLLQAGQDEGIFELIDPQTTSFAILEVGMGVSRWFHEGRGLTVERLCDVHEALALRMAGYAGGDPTR